MVSAPGGTLFPTMVMGSLPRPQRIRDLSRTGTRDTSAVRTRSGCSTTPCPWLSGCRSGPGWTSSPMASGVVRPMLRFSPRRWTGSSRTWFRGPAPAFPSGSPPLRSVRPRRRFQHQSKKTHRGRRSGVPEDHKSSSIIVALPSPYTLGWRMWSAEHSTSAFPTRDDFMEAIIPIVHREIQKLARLGVDAIQLDNPWPQVVVDPHYRRSSPPVVCTTALELGIDAGRHRGGLRPRSGALRKMHQWRHRRNRGRVPQRSRLPHPWAHHLGILRRDYRRSWPDEGTARFVLEFATPDAGVTGALRDFPEDKLLGLGVIHPSDRNVESPVAVAGLVERAMEFVPKERITLNPNCGFAPGGGRRASKHGGVRRGVPEAWSHVSRRKAAAGSGTDELGGHPALRGGTPLGELFRRSRGRGVPHGGKSCPRGQDEQDGRGADRPSHLRQERHGDRTSQPADEPGGDAADDQRG